jgi:hypothetical protein
MVVVGGWEVVGGVTDIILKIFDIPDCYECWD